MPSYHLKRLFAVLMSVVLLASAYSASLVYSKEALAANSGTPAQVTEAIDGAVEHILSSDSGVDSDWEAIALARAGHALPRAYFNELEAAIVEAEGSFSSVTEYERTALAVTAAGFDASNFAGYDLIDSIVNHPKISAQSINSLLFGLLALDSGLYEIPEGAVWTREKMVEGVLAAQKDDGGFSFGDGASDPDLSAMVLTALAPYTPEAAVKDAADKIAAWLSSNQQSHGGYNSYGSDSSESVAQAIIALTANGIDPTETRFTKEGVTLVDKLLSFRQQDGGFAHVAAEPANGMATEQALLALVAYDLFVQGQGSVYDFTGGVSGLEPLPPVAATVVVEGPQAAISVGSVQASNALDALLELSESKNFEVEMTESSYGPFVSAVDGIASAAYGGWDGWQYIVKRDGSWISPATSMDQFTLEAGDTVIVYYGDSGTQYIKSAVVSPLRPAAGQPFTVTVTQTAFDWTSGSWIDTPATAVQVAIGDASVVTDEHGVASFADGSVIGTADALTVTGYAEGKAPTVLRYNGPLSLVPAFVDEADISDWALEAVGSAYANGIMTGVSDNEPRFAPHQRLTRAQFAAILLRLLGETPADASTAQTFNDVAPGSWYFGEVMAASKLGIVGGVTDTTFEPDRLITRQEMAIMVGRAYELAPPQSQIQFEDKELIYAEALPYASTLYELGVMSGLADGYFDPALAVTREMAAVVVVRLLQLPAA